MGAKVNVTARILINALLDFVSNQNKLQIEEIWFVNIEGSNTASLIQEFESSEFKKIHNQDQKQNKDSKLLDINLDFKSDLLDSNDLKNLNDLIKDHFERVKDLTK